MLLKISKNADFMTEYIMQCIILLLKASKNANFMMEHIIQCIILLLKTSKMHQKRTSTRDSCDTCKLLNCYEMHGKALA